MDVPPVLDVRKMNEVEITRPRISHNLNIHKTGVVIVATTTTYVATIRCIFSDDYILKGNRSILSYLQTSEDKSSTLELTGTYSVGYWARN